ncbi:MAG: SRPBCC domain-containing protein [Proteobacteria bacterium]|nr:SRPBCC domain-containing protein [Pseudomonadota bacterium]
MDIIHETLTFKQSFPVSLKRLFRAFTDPREREAWGRPSETAEIRIEHSDVRTGGTETARCGTKGDLRWTVHVSYHLVETDRLIVYSEAVSEAGAIQHTSLVTVEFLKSADGSASVILTDQIASFIGRDGIKGHQFGHSKALANLRSLLQNS